uniref:DDE Tnp4 domain-containing protein n=1 Tax=Acrobeloides nanus TaxID=290746 RepID=A0A914DF73_9BILA
MAAKWRILLKAIECNDATADLIVKAICVLHNFVIDERSLNPTTLADSVDDDNGLWRQEVLQPLESIEMRRRYANTRDIMLWKIEENLSISLMVLEWFHGKKI